MKESSFKKITIEDQQAIEFYLHKYSTFCLSAFTFSSLVAWESIFHYQWAVMEDTLLIKFVPLEKKQEHFMQPLGEFPPNLQQQIIHHAQSLGYALTIFGISNAFLAKYSEFASHFVQAEHRDMDNYIYLAEDLALLPGKKYQAKRNLLHQFEKNHTWTSENISVENIPACLEVINTIYSQQELDSNSFLAFELRALTFILTHFPRFQEMGILIRINAKPAAFSIFEHLNSSTAVVHFEKAIRQYKGLYQLVNRETAKIILKKGYKYINREEDLGIEGLRKTKLSYHPLELCPAHALVFKR